MTGPTEMTFNRDKVLYKPIKVFQVNDSTLLAIYKGRLSKYDILVKYKQKSKNGKWSRIRTPKHIHWTVDILLKMQSYKKLTREFLEFFIDTWEKTTPIKSAKARKEIDLEQILNIDKKKIKKFKKLSKSGEYSVKFLILLAKLLMIQEKTNCSDAYMFKDVLDGLKSGNDLFQILSAATLRKQ